MVDTKTVSINLSVRKILKHRKQVLVSILNVPPSNMKEAFLVEMLLERKDRARIHNKQAIIGKTTACVMYKHKTFVFTTCQCYRAQLTD